MAHEYAQVVDEEWVSFPGGELQGRRPKALCMACRDALKQAALASVPSSPSRSSPSRPLCFQCYRADLERERALIAAGTLDTSSDARFQFQLPFEPVNRARLEALKAVRAGARAAAIQGVGVYAAGTYEAGTCEARRRQAQIAARHALQLIVAGLQARRLTPAALTAATHAAELQLPEAWLPFVVSR